MVHKVIGSGLEKGAQWDCHHEWLDKRLKCESRSKMGEHSVSIQVEVRNDESQRQVNIEICFSFLVTKIVVDFFGLCIYLPNPNKKRQKNYLLHKNNNWHHIF